MRAHEFIDEIENVGQQSFPISDPTKILPHASPFGRVDAFDLFRYDQDEDRYLVLVKDGQVANYTAFMEIAPHRWMSRRSQSYDPFKGNKLTAKVLRELKSRGISLQSDIQQSPDSFKVWDKHLPSIGLHPKVLDRSTGKVYDRDAVALSGLFTIDPNTRPRYCFVMESNDYYSRINLGLVYPQLSGFRNLWWGEYNVLNEHAELTQCPQVYLDLDGVVANFFAGYRKLNPSVTHEEDMPDGPDHTYDLMKGTDFFYRLPVYPSAQELVATILDFVPSYYVCSAPLEGDRENCRRNKVAWVRRRLTPQPKRIYITRNKWRYAVQERGVPNVLIDDKAKNLDPWREAGGIAIEYFAPRDSVGKVREQLQEIFRS